MPARAFFDALPGRVDADQIAGIDNSYLFEVTGEGQWLVEVRDGKVTVTEGADGEDADVIFTTSGETFDRLASGAQNPTTAYMTGKLKIDGDLGAAMKLQKLF
jgi:putative sterol carrier protein